MILPVQSTTSASGKRFLISAASPTATMFSPSVTTDPFHRTWFLGPSVTTIPFSNLVVISVPFALAVVLTNTASSHCPTSVNVPQVHPENEPVWRNLPCPVRARTGRDGAAISQRSYFSTRSASSSGRRSRMVIAPTKHFLAQIEHPMHRAASECG